MAGALQALAYGRCVSGTLLRERAHQQLSQPVQRLSGGAAVH